MFSRLPISFNLAFNPFNWRPGVHVGFESGIKFSDLNQLFYIVNHIVLMIVPAITIKNAAPKLCAHQLT